VLNISILKHPENQMLAHHIKVQFGFCQFHSFYKQIFKYRIAIMNYQVTSMQRFKSSLLAKWFSNFREEFIKQTIHYRGKIEKYGNMKENNFFVYKCN
jgi:hypothetical protein